MNLSSKIRSDLHRYGLKNVSLFKILYLFIFSTTPGIRFVINFRVLQKLLNINKFLAVPFFLNHRRLKVKYGFDISYRTQIGEGFYIGHFGGIVIHGDTIIGKCCNISQGVTIGISNHGKIGTPVIGNKVFIGPGSVIIGKIKIGNNVTIGANTLVNFDVPDFKTVVSSKSVIIDKDLSNNYIHNIS